MSRGAIMTVCSLGLLLLAGCGGSSPTPSVTPASIKGNWLLTGSMPTFSAGQNSGFNLATTIDVVNGQIIADVEDFFPCTNSGAGGAGQAAVATIASDGSFTLQPASLGGLTPTINYTIHGQVPQTASSSWTGSYTATNANTGCNPVSGSFTAVPIAPVTGTFSGAASITPANTALGMPITVSLTLQQGGAASLDDTSTTRPVNSVNVLTGSIRVTGTSCFSSGTTSATSGDVLGGSVNATFTMDDGSQILFHGDIVDPTTATIQMRSMVVNGGNCDRWFSGSRAALARQ